MKYSVLLTALVFFTLVAAAQTKINPNESYRQKRFLDSLRNAYKSPAIIINPTPQLVYNTPVAPLTNEGETWGMSGQDTIYKMKRDNMLLLKPNNNTTSIPNATDGKVFMVPPAKKKP